MNEIAIYAEHLKDLYASGLNDATLDHAKIESITQTALEKELNIKLPQGNVYSAIKIPYNVDFSRFKVFPPVIWKEGEKPQKYLQKKGSGIQVYWPDYRNQSRNKDPLYITEGEKKALKGFQEGLNIIGLGGVWNWKTSDSERPISELLEIDWLDREVFLVPDSDWILNQNVMLAVHRLGSQLQRLGACVWVLNLKTNATANKVGLDDYLVQTGIEAFEEEIVKNAISLNHKIFKENGISKKPKKPKKKNDGVQKVIKATEIPDKLPPLSGKANDLRTLIFSLGYEFRFNVVLNTVEVKNDIKEMIFLGDDITENNAIGLEWTPLDDRQYNFLSEQVRQYEGFASYPETRIERLIKSEFCSSPFDPFKDFYEKNKWDGIPRIVGLWKCIEVTNKDTFKLFSRWLINCVPCMLGLSKNEVCLTLQGDIGVYKTTFLNELFERVPEFLKYVTTSENIDPKDKDALRRMAEYGLINLDELDAINKTESGSVRLLFSLEKIECRYPYDRYITHARRRANFCGGVNTLDFLKDENNARRFFVLKVKSVDMEKFHKIDMSQVWLEAYETWKGGAQFWLSGAEIQDLKIANEEFLNISVAEELLLQKIKKPEKTENHPQNWHTTTAIASYILDNATVTNSFKNELGRALKKHNYEKKRIDNVWKWNVIL